MFHRNKRFHQQIVPPWYFKIGGNRIGCLIIAGMISCINLFGQRREKSYYEDLSKQRPIMDIIPDTVQQESDLKEPTYVPATHTVNRKVNAVLDSLDRFYKTRLYIEGFAIQLYSGQNKIDALAIRKKMLDESFGMIPDIQFVQPKFRVITGRYFTKLEAHRDLFRLRRIFPDAIIIPEKIPLSQ